jgi:GlpG protein
MGALNPIAAIGRASYQAAMRTLGSLPSEAAALRLSEILDGEGIANQCESEDDGTVSIWVLDEEKIARGAELLRRFRETPEAPELRQLGSKGRENRAREARSTAARRSTVADTARIGYEREYHGIAYVPIALIVLCIAVAIYSQVGKDDRALAPLRISNYAWVKSGGWWENVLNGEHGTFLAEVRAGQVWRLVTPILIHFGLLHLVFNMFMLRDLGTIIENRLGAIYLGVFVLVLAILSNVAEYAWAGRPNFGGMSGVVYGLFGFWWIRGKYDGGAIWPINQTTVQILLIWYVLCLVGIIGAIANVAHTAGLVLGMAWGYLSARK